MDNKWNRDIEHLQERTPAAADHEEHSSEFLKINI